MQPVEVMHITLHHNLHTLIDTMHNIVQSSCLSPIGEVTSYTCTNLFTAQAGSHGCMPCMH